MTINTVCPPDCPGRYPGCGATCEKFLKHRAESAERYKRNIAKNEIIDTLNKARRRISRK